MAIRPKDIYEGTKKTHRVSKIITAVIILLIALAIGLFFGLRQYCVYDDEGNATLIMPWDRKDGENEGTEPAKSDNAPSPSPSATAPASPEPSGTGTPEDAPPDEPDATDAQPDAVNSAPSDTPADTPTPSIDLGADTGNP